MNISFAEGPIYSHKDKFVNQEFQNAYQDIRSKIPTYSSSTFLSLSSAGAIVSSVGGEVRQPFQPSFLATDGTGAANVTGDGTFYTIGFPTVVFDQGSDFTANSTFTASVNGRYFFNGSLFVQEIASGHTGTAYLQVVASNRTLIIDYKQNAYVGSQSSGYLHLHGFGFVDMEAGDTAYLQVRISGSTKVIDIVGNAQLNYFSGSLIN